ncbi:MAG: hypothetical protein WBI14_09920 [Anaerolineaceae bacterium]
MRKSIKAFIISLILLSVFNPVAKSASATDQTIFGIHNATITPNYVGTIRITAGLSISAGGLASCSATVSLYSGYVANLTMYLQRKGSNGYWTTIESWSGNGSGISGVSLFESYSGLAKGTTYRVYAVAYVYQNGNYIEQVTISSQERTY